MEAIAGTGRNGRDAPQGVVGGSAIEAATLVVATLEGLIGSDHLTTRLRYEADLRHDG